MTTVISFFGGPCTGKSLSAALVYADMKQRGLSVELVREVVKDWAWEDRKITGFSQYYTTAKQIMKESLLLGKVDYVVTDSPPLLGIAYAKMYYSKNIQTSLRATVVGYYEELRALGHTVCPVYLLRQEEYTAEGRWQNKTEARVLDGAIRLECYDMFSTFMDSTSTASDLKAFVDGLLERK